MAEKPQYTKPSSTLWAEEQEKNGNASSKVLSTYSDEPVKSDGNDRKLAVEGNETEAYVGVDPIYQTYANDTEAPLRAEKGVEAKLEERVYGDDGVKAKTEKVEESKTEKVEESKTEPTPTPSTGGTPASGVKAPGNK